MHYFYDHIGKEDENLGSVKQCVTSIDVSSYSVSHTQMFVFDLIYRLCSCVHFLMKQILDSSCMSVKSNQVFSLFIICFFTLMISQICQKWYIMIVILLSGVSL